MSTLLKNKTRVLTRSPTLTLIQCVCFSYPFFKAPTLLLVSQTIGENQDQYQRKKLSLLCGPKNEKRVKKDLVKKTIVVHLLH